MSLSKRLSAAITRRDTSYTELPWQVIISAPEAREILDALRVYEEWICEDCSAFVPEDPSPCDHHVICSTCWPSTCQQCQAELDVEMRGA